jgi:5-methylcytosine-specific restriction endonuclease McrA
MNQAFVQSLNNQDLIASTEYVVEQERKIVQVVIWHLQEIQERRLYLSMNYTSLYECLIKHFKMSDTTAYGRIKVLKILEDVPTVSEALKTGDLNISNIALAHSYIEKHQKVTGEELSLNDKVELIENLKNKTNSEVKELLARCNQDFALPHYEIRLLTKTHGQMKSTISNELVEKIEHLKSLISHENINPTHEELLNLAFDALIEKVEKKKGIHQRQSKPAVEKMAKSAAQRTKTQETPPIADASSKTAEPPTQEKTTQQITDGNTRYIPKSVKRFILKRAAGKCEHIHTDGERCSSHFQTQFDHVIAFSKGGKTIAENMQLLCRVHNAAKGSK